MVTGSGPPHGSPAELTVASLKSMPGSSFWPQVLVLTIIAFLLFGGFAPLEPPPSSYLIPHGIHVCTACQQLLNSNMLLLCILSLLHGCHPG
jgi:hypothetical protein